MKRILSIVLSIALVLSVAAVIGVTSSADTASGRAGVSKLIYDFEDDDAKDDEGNLSATANKYRSKLWSANDNAWNGTDIVVNSTLADSPFSTWKSTYGNFSAMEHGSGTTHGFYLPSGWADPYTVDGKTYQRPNAIVFDVMTTGGDRSYSKTTLNGTSVEVTGEIKTNQITTITVRIPKDMDLSAENAIFKWNVWTQNQKLYLDNVRVEYYDGYQATFEGTETAVLASAVDSIFQDNTKGETSITLPTATLDGDKEFAGWVTADDIKTVIPANTVVSLEDDVTYYAVATDRGPYPTPDAPTVVSKTFNSVTLTALGSDYVYSKDGETWQTSNVFTSLAPSTTYTFYTKHIATLAYDESAVSEGTTVTTDVIEQFEFSKEYVTLSDNTANLQFNTGLAYKCITANVAADKSTTVTTNYTVAPGVYDLTLFARSYSIRAQVDIEINGTVVGESVDTSATGSGGDNVGFALSSISIPQTTVLTIKITTKTAGNLYLNSLKLTKTDDCYMAMDPGAAMRIDGTTDGLRFSATVNTEWLTDFNKNYTVTDYGMLIAPAESNLNEDTMIVDNAQTMLTKDATFDAVNKKAVIARYQDIKPVADEASGLTQIFGSLVEIDTKNATKGYVARAYIEYKDGNETKYEYSNISESRTIQEVAQAVKADTEYYDSLCESHQAVVDKYLPASESTES